MNIKSLKNSLVGFLLLSSGFSQASVITLDFEGAGDNATIDDFYNGGTDSLGNSGVDYGISFGNDALSCIDQDAGGSCQFANEPTPDTVMFFLSGSSVLNNAAGFDTGFSFFYTSSEIVSVGVYSEMNLTGTLLGTINLLANYQSNSCVGDPSGSFCNWDVGSLAFTGTAKSIDFGGTANQVGFDNITFGSVNPDKVDVPEPSTLAIFVLGMVGFTSRRFNKSFNK